MALTPWRGTFTLSLLSFAGALPADLAGSFSGLNAPALCIRAEGRDCLSPISWSPSAIAVTSTTSLSSTPVSVSTKPTFSPNITSYTCEGLTPAASCPTKKYWYPKPQNWEDANTTAWLNEWWTRNNATIAEKGGFTSAFGAEFINNPDFTCAEVSSSTNCNFDPCDITCSSNNHALESSYYVLESTRRLHGYFASMAETLQTSAIGAALKNQDWAYTFYQDKNLDNWTVLREIANAMIVLATIAATVAAPELMVAAGVAAAIFGGGLFAGVIAVQSSSDDTPQKAAQVGSGLAQLFVTSMNQFVSANAVLMKGQSYGDSGNLAQWIDGGHWVNFEGVNETSTIHAWNSLLAATAINGLWRQQKVFIMGGGPCDDSFDLGQGPQNAKLCIDGKAWYLYFWREFGGLQVGKKQWGQVDAPPGFDQLGTGAYSDITYQHIISSSLAAYKQAQYNYTFDLAQNRLRSALTEGWANPATQGAAWEGIFTIPVCDIDGIQNQNFDRRETILQPWGSGKIPTWCGPVCNNDQAKTDAFINAANMKNFQSPKTYCDEDGGRLWKG